jgi:putative endonuclease
MQEVAVMRKYCRRVGGHGEDFAAKVLEDSGFRILDRNYRSRTGEIDIIAVKDGVIHFVEVKTRTGDEYGYPSDAVTESKRHNIRRTAECYLSERHAVWRTVSLDVMEVTADLIEDCM